MLFTIKKTETRDGRTVVTGDTLTGTLRGIWKGSDAPVTGKSCQTELSLRDISRSEITILKAGTQPHISLVGDMVTFVCMAEDKDDIYYLRFSGDGLEMLGITDDDGTIQAGDIISFSLRYDEIGIYPYM